MKYFGKTVFILGAGASVHQGAPLLNDFLEKAHALSFSKGGLDNQESFDTLFKWLSELRASNVAGFTDLRNLENVFSMISLLKETGDDFGKTLYAHMTKVIFETLERSILFSNQLPPTNSKLRDIGGSPTYAHFVHLVHAMNERRRLDLPKGKFQRDSFITFNYDLLLERALQVNDLTFTYHLEGDPPCDGYSVLKLHGSMNWYLHHDCKKPSTEGKSIRWYNMDESIMPRHGETRPGIVSFSKTRSQSCPDCQHGNAVLPVFIPPTWSKSAESARIGRIWAKALREIGSANQLVVIGYSLPKTDTFFSYLMALGLKGNGDLKRVLLVDPNPELRGQYQTMFGSIPVEVNTDPLFKGRFEELAPRLENFVYT
jgi:hypothetical protein